MSGSGPIAGSTSRGARKPPSSSEPARSSTPDLLTARARYRPPRRALLQMLVTPVHDHLHYCRDEDAQVDEIGQEEQHEYAARGFALGIQRPGREERECPYAPAERGRHRHHPARPQNRLLASGPGGLAGPGRDRLDAEVGGEGG